MIEYNTLRFAVEGYPSRWSYRPGESVPFHCSSLAPAFSVEVARIGAAREVVWRGDGIPGEPQPVPPDAHSAGCGWPVSFTLPIGEAWRSGFYEVALRADGVAGTEPVSHAFFVVRSPQPGRDTSILMVLGTNTYNAYNKWGGACLYTGSPRVSFQRPLERGFVWKPSDPDGFDGRDHESHGGARPGPSPPAGLSRRQQGGDVELIRRLVQLGAAASCAGRRRTAFASTTPSTATSSSVPSCSTATS